MLRIIELIQKDYEGKAIHLTIAHSNSLEAAEQLCAMIKEQLEVKSESQTHITLGPVIGAHVGPGTVAAFVNSV
ncbi:hypothetical protein D3C73_775010 [compost metagenome]